jgi:hypothetical protein
MSEQEVLKIEIPVEEEEAPLKAERSRPGAKTAAFGVTKKVAGLAKEAAQRAAQSETGRKAAGKVQEVTDRGVRYVGTRMADTAEDQARQTIDAVQERLQQTDWEKEAKTGIAAGLQWASKRIGELSERFTPEDSEQ